MCTCETKQAKQTKQTKQADDKSNEKELMWKKLRSSLQNIQVSDRPMFMIRCGGGNTCTAKDIPDIKWLEATTEIAKNRFWQTYTCFKAQDIRTCPVDGYWGAWSAWSRCSARCGEEANITSTRLCDNPFPVNEGLPCSGYNTKSSVCRGECNLSRTEIVSLVESEAFLTKIHRAYPRLRSLCLLGHCLYDQAVKVLPPGDVEKYWSSVQCVKYKRSCPVDGGWASWTHWSACEPRCGSGVQWRIRHCSSPPPANNGLICRGPFYEEKPCVGMWCKKNDFRFGIYVSDWTVFGPCSVSCGQYGMKEKRKVCLLPGRCGFLLARNGNKIVITKPCFRGPCPVDGVWSTWSEYTKCSADCGKGRKIRTRTCDGVHSTDSTICTGQSLNVTSCENKCKKDPILINGTGNVTASPFVPVQEGSPKVRKPDPKNPYLFELEPDRFSHFTIWSTWSQCSKSCETGQKSRSRNCTVAGRCFGEVRQTLFCNTNKCPVNGGWSKWLAWSHCSVTCGLGQQWRYRKCNKPLPQFGGTCFGHKEQVKRCYLGPCKSLNMEFGPWSAWSSCSKKCGGGERVRKRSCKLKYHKFLSRMSCRNRYGDRLRRRCGQKPCQVDGDWAHWGSWSACSHSCGGGVHFRDRTCTDPAPLYGGKSCKGHGSEVTPCFHGPCPDREDTGVRMNGSSGLLYSPFHKPQSYLSLNLLLHPLSPHGTIVYRSSACRVEKCRHSVNVSLVDGKPHVVVVNKGSRITLKSNTTLQVREWYTIYVYLSQYHGFLRVNNGAHWRAKYIPKPNIQVNYDSEMTLGAKSGNGFVGVIAEANVNFQVLSLQRLSGWNGNGMPEDEWLTENVHVDPVTKYPKFKSDTFLKLFIRDRKTLTIQMTIWPQQLEGLVLFNKGRIPGSFVYLIIHKGVFRYCFNCGQLSVCENIQDVEAMRWYHVSIIVSGIMSSIRINLGKAVQLTSPRLPYHTGSHVFVGGGESHDWVYLTEITGTDRGFSGAFHEVTINDQHYTLRAQPLVDNRGFMNTEGVSSTEKMMEVLEGSHSKVVLRCDFSRYAHLGSDVNVEWFHVDTKIKSSPDRKITPKLPGHSYIGALTLSAKHHGSGLYVCMVRHNGRLTNHIAFVLIRDNTKLVYDMASMEVAGIEDFLIFMAIFALFALMFSTYRMYQLTKKDGIRPIVEQLKQFRARLLIKHGVEPDFRQPPGVDDLYKAELIPEKITNETEDNSNDATKDSQDKDSEKGETPETGDIATDLHSSLSVEDVDSSYSVEDDGNEEQQPITPPLQSITNHPSTYSTSGAIFRQPNTISQGGRRSSLLLYGTQSARSNTNDNEIPKRSSKLLSGTQSASDGGYDAEIPRRVSVKLSGTQSFREDIDDEEIPKGKSVQLHGTQSAREGIDDDEMPRRASVRLSSTQRVRKDIDIEEIPRRSSVQLRGSKSSREDTIDDEIPRRSLVMLHGTHSARGDIDDEILSSEIVTIDDSQYALPDQNHEMSLWSPHTSNISLRGDNVKGTTSHIYSQGHVSRGMANRASQIDDVRGVSSHIVPKIRSSFSSREKLGSSHQVLVTENNDDAQPPKPQISWTHRSTEKITQDSFRSGTSQSPSRQLSSALENQLSSSLPPAGSPSPPRSSLVRISPLHQQPDLGITVSANRSLTGTMDRQNTLSTLSTETAPRPASHETSSDGTSSSSDQSSELVAGTDSETSLSFPPLPTPPTPTP